MVLLFFSPIATYIPYHNIQIVLYSYVSSTVKRKNQYTDFLYNYIVSLFFPPIATSIVLYSYLSSTVKWENQYTDFLYTNIYVYICVCVCVLNSDVMESRYKMDRLLVDNLI